MDIGDNCTSLVFRTGNNLLKCWIGFILTFARLIKEQIFLSP